MQRLAAVLLTCAIMVDGAIAEEKLTASDGAALDQFAFSVALDGHIIVVGSLFDTIGTNTNQGSAYIFTRSGTAWTERAKLTASDGAAGDEFGFSVAISGDTIAIGADEDDIGANENQGSASIFVRAGNAWIQQAKLTATDGTPSDLFGFSIAIDRDTVVIGAAQADVGPFPAHGTAYIFVRTGTSWTQQARLDAIDGFTSDDFGFSVAISGDTVVIGSDRHDTVGNRNQGAAYVFVRRANQWTQQAKLIASDGAMDDQFGRSVAMSGDTIIVGSWAARVGENANQGAAYIFVRQGEAWMQQAKLTASDGAFNDRFGISVSISGETVAVGSFGDDIGANTNQGSVSIFGRRGGVWTHRMKLAASDGATFDSLGRSVAMSGSTVVAGADLDDVASNLDQGSAHVFQTDQLLRRRAVRR